MFERNRIVEKLKFCEKHRYFQKIKAVFILLFLYFSYFFSMIKLFLMYSNFAPDYVRKLQALKYLDLRHYKFIHVDNRYQVIFAFSVQLETSK